MATAAELDLWDFAVALYRQPGVESLCLALQDDWDVDVTVLLFSVWLSMRGLLFDDARRESVQSQCEPWQAEVIAPLRRARRWLKTQSSQTAAVAACRNTIRDAELAAEKLQLQRLQAMAEDWTEIGERDRQLSNVSRYLRPLVAPEVEQKAVARLQDATATVAP